LTSIGVKCYLINVLNFQYELPNIPVEGILIKIKLDGKLFGKLVRLPKGKIWLAK